MKNYCLVIICINKPFNCVIRLITIMIHNIRRNNSTIFNTDKLISLFDCIFDHFIWRETTFISLRQKIFSAQNFTHTVIKLSQFYKIFLFCISDNHRNLSLQLPVCKYIIPFLYVSVGAILHPQNFCLSLDILLHFVFLILHNAPHFRSLFKHMVHNSCKLLLCQSNTS